MLGTLALSLAVFTASLGIAGGMVARAQVVGYFGPAQVNIASTISDPYPLFFVQTVYQQADQLFVKGACIASLNATGFIPTSGGMLGSFPGRVELPGDLVFAAFIDNYAGPARFGPESSPTCFLLLVPGSPSGARGTCMVIDGHYGGTPDFFGQTWVVDHLRPC